MPTVDQSIADRFAAVAGAYPERPAISWQGHELTYASLARSMNGTARQLLQAGVSRGDRVALFFDRGAASVGALLGDLPCRGKLPVTV